MALGIWKIVIIAVVAAAAIGGVTVMILNGKDDKEVETLDGDDMATSRSDGLDNGRPGEDIDEEEQLDRDRDQDMDQQGEKQGD